MSKKGYRARKVPLVEESYWLKVKIDLVGGGEDDIPSIFAGGCLGCPAHGWAEAGTR